MEGPREELVGAKDCERSREGFRKYNPANVISKALTAFSEGLALILSYMATSVFPRLRVQFPYSLEQ